MAPPMTPNIAAAPTAAPTSDNLTAPPVNFGLPGAVFPIGGITVPTAVAEAYTAVGIVTTIEEGAPAGPQGQTVVTVVQGMVGMIGVVQPQWVSVRVCVIEVVVRPVGQTFT